MALRKLPARKIVEALKHDEASRKNIPTAEYQSLSENETQSPIQVAYERRNRDLDPKPESGRIAVKVINHLGDEVMKVFRV